MRYDLNRYGNPGRARGELAGCRVMTVAAVFLWLAFAANTFLWPNEDGWPLLFPVSVATVTAGWCRLNLRRQYGVRQAQVWPGVPVKTIAGQFAEAGEMLMRAQADAITGRYQARPPGPARFRPVRGQQERGPRPVPKPAAEQVAETMASLGYVFNGLDPAHDLNAAKVRVMPGPCVHPDAEPVDLLVTGERVAWCCPDCPAELPAGWR